MENLKVKNELLNCMIQFKTKQTNLLMFLKVSYITRVITHLSITDSNFSEKLKQEDKNLIPNYEKSMTSLKNSHRNVDDFYNELAYKLYYQSFEEYLFDVLVVLFENFPSFLNKENINMRSELLFKESDLTLIRRKIIENKAKTLIQNNNIKSLLNKFKTIFGFEISIRKQQLDALLIASKIRNILTHNNGQINEIFIEELKSENITTNYKKGEYIFKSLQSEVDSMENLLTQLGEEINQEIISKIPQIRKYSLNI